MLAAIRAVALEDISIFTNEFIPAKVLYANYRSDETDRFCKNKKGAVALATAPSRTN
jgi:hypothetical protein